MEKKKKEKIIKAIVLSFCSILGAFTGVNIPIEQVVSEIGGTAGGALGLGLGSIINKTLEKIGIFSIFK